MIQHVKFLLALMSSLRWNNGYSKVSSLSLNFLDLNNKKLWLCKKKFSLLHISKTNLIILGQKWRSRNLHNRRCKKREHGAKAGCQAKQVCICLKGYGKLEFLQLFYTYFYIQNLCKTIKGTLSQFVCKRSNYK